MKVNKSLLTGVVLASAILILAGCGKKENPYEPDPLAIQNTAGRYLYDPNWISISPDLGGTINDQDPGTSGTQGEIIITFSYIDLDPATVNLNNIILGGGTVNNPDLKFYPELKKAVISGTFADASWFTITIKPGLRTKAGMPIDGNRNGQFDGTPYDDFRFYVRTAGAPAAQEPNITNPKVTGWYPTTRGNYNSGVVYITINFDANDYDTVSVRTNIFLTDSLGNNIPLRTISFGPPMIFTGVGPGDTLCYDTRYTLRFVVNNMTDIGTNGANKNKATWGNHGYIANVPDLVIDFRTRPANVSVDYLPLRYSTYFGGIVFGELLIVFNDSLDYSTINNSTVKIYRTNSTRTHIFEAVNCRVYHQPGDVAQRRFRVTTTNCIPGNYYQLWISRFIKDNAGWYLDGNNNFIGGEAGNQELGLASDDVKINF